MQFFIRKVLEADAVPITRLSNQLGYPLSTADTLQNLRAMNSDDEIALVAVKGNEIVGWIHAFKTVRLESGTFAEIGGLVVDQQHNRMGIGRALVENLREWCTGKGIVSLRVRCNVKRSEAHEFYKAMGFAESKQQKVFETALINK